MPTLPIYSRYASVQGSWEGDPSEASTDSGNGSFCSTSTASAGLQVKVKNTFLEIDNDDDNDKDPLRKPRRSRTCCAKLTNATAFGIAAETVLTDDSDTDVSSLSTDDNSLVDATPVHDDVMMSYPYVPLPHVALAGKDDADCTRITSSPADMNETSLSSAAELTLHVPLASLGICSSGIPEHAVTVRSTFSEGRNCVIDLRVVIGPTNTHVLPMPLLPPSYPANALPPPKKHASVCCHWKNKGWCKYQSQCKFQHPAHKRGVGAEAWRPEKMSHLADTLLNQRYVQMQL